jgi:peptide/nickel transport system permease protein
VRVLSDTATRLQAADPLFWALIFLTWMPYARMLYATVSVPRSSEYVQAAVAMGAGMGRILFRHILPNSIAPAIVLLARDIGAVVILQASFAFAGFGGASPWGQLLLAGRNWMIGPGGNTLTYWWVWLPATLVLILYGVGWNLLGDGLNDALNPRV